MSVKYYEFVSFFLSYPVCNVHILYAALYCRKWPLWLYHIFPHKMFFFYFLYTLSLENLSFEV